MAAISVSRFFLNRSPRPLADVLYQVNDAIYLLQRSGRTGNFKPGHYILSIIFNTCFSSMSSSGYLLVFLNAFMNFLFQPFRNASRFILLQYIQQLLPFLHKIAANIKHILMLTAIIVSISNEFKTLMRPAVYLMTPHPILVPALPDGCDV